MREVIRHLRRAALLNMGNEPSDSQLLESFLDRREEAAFEALLRRHGPMVLGVCRRILRNLHDAEDAFQATFLVLARKANSILPREKVGGWLYGVAYRTAMKARAMSSKRRMRETHARPLPRCESSVDEELLARLDDALNRLPEKYRLPIILCELDGRSRKEVARMLDLPEGTLSWRLAHAKKLLAKRLSRHELAIPLGALAVGLSPTLRVATLKTALEAGAAPAKVLALTEGMIKAMFLTKLKITVCVATLALVAGVGVTGLTYQASADEPNSLEYQLLPVKRAETRPATDDLEALRLEIEALRKELRATKERVKTLEDQARGQKGAKAASAQYKEAYDHAVRERARIVLDRELEARRALEANKLLMDAESALKRLREKTDDKQAINALEQALQRLKERDKSKSPEKVSPGESLGK